MLYTNNLTISR